MKTWRIFAQFFIISFILFHETSEGSAESHKKPVNSEPVISGDVHPHVQPTTDQHTALTSAPTNFVDSDHFLILVCSVCVVIVLAIIVAICVKIIKEYKLSLERVHNATVYRGNIPFWKPTWWFASYLFCRTCCTCALCRGQLAMLGVMGELAEASGNVITGDQCQAKHGYTEPLLPSNYKRSFESDQPDYKSFKHFKPVQVFDTPRARESKKYLHSSIDESASPLGCDISYLEDCGITEQVYEIPPLNDVPIQTVPHASRYPPAANERSKYSATDGGPWSKKPKSLTPTTIDTRYSRDGQNHYSPSDNLQPIKEESFTQNPVDSIQPTKQSIANPKSRSVYWTGGLPENNKNIQETDSDHFYDRITSSEHIYDSISSTDQQESSAKSSKANKKPELGIDSAKHSEHSSFFSRLRRGKSAKVKTCFQDKKQATKAVNKGGLKDATKRHTAFKYVPNQCSTVPSSFKGYVQILDKNKEKNTATPLQSTDSCPRYHAPSLPGPIDLKLKSKLAHNKVEARSKIAHSKTVQFGPNSKSAGVESVTPAGVNADIQEMDIPDVSRQSSIPSYISPQEKDYKVIKDIYSLMSQQIDKRAASPPSTQTQSSSSNKQNLMAPASRSRHISSATVHGALSRLSRDARASQTGNGQGIFAPPRNHTRNNNATNQYRGMPSSVIKNKASRLKHNTYILPHLAHPPRSQLGVNRNIIYSNCVRPLDETTLFVNNDKCVMSYKPHTSLIAHTYTRDCFGLRQRQVERIKEETCLDHNYFTYDPQKDIRNHSVVETTNTVSSGVSVVLNNKCSEEVSTSQVASVPGDKVQLGHLLDLDHSNNADKACVACHVNSDCCKEANKSMFCTLPHLSTSSNIIRFENHAPSLDDSKYSAAITGYCSESGSFQSHNSSNKNNAVVSHENAEDKYNGISNNQVSIADGTLWNLMPKHDLNIRISTDGEENQKIVLSSNEYSSCIDARTASSYIFPSHNLSPQSETITTEAGCLGTTGFNEINTDLTIQGMDFHERIQIINPCKSESRPQPRMSSTQDECCLTLQLGGVRGNTEPLLQYAGYQRPHNGHNNQDTEKSCQHILPMIRHTMVDVLDDSNSVQRDTYNTRITHGVCSDNDRKLDTRVADNIDFSCSLSTIEEEQVPAVLPDNYLTYGPTSVTQSEYENKETALCTTHIDLRSPRSYISVDLLSDNEDQGIKSISISNLVEGYYDMPIKPISVNIAYSETITPNVCDMNSIYSPSESEHTNESKTTTLATSEYLEGMATRSQNNDGIQISAGVTGDDFTTSNIQTDSTIGVNEFCDQISAILSPDNLNYKTVEIDVNHSDNCNYVLCMPDCIGPSKGDFFMAIDDHITENHSCEHSSNQHIENSFPICRYSDSYSNSDELVLSLANSSSESCILSSSPRSSASPCCLGESTTGCATGEDSPRTGTYVQRGRMNCEGVAAVKYNHITTVNAHGHCNDCISDVGLINAGQCVGCNESGYVTDGNVKYIDRAVTANHGLRLESISPVSACRPTSSEEELTDILNPKQSSVQIL